MTVTDFGVIFGLLALNVQINRGTSLRQKSLQDLEKHSEFMS